MLVNVFSCSPYKRTIDFTVGFLNKPYVVFLLEKQNLFTFSKDAFKVVCLKYENIRTIR
jgi:hypothetical protein